MIELICPSRGRPEKLKRMWRSALETAGGELHLTVGVLQDEYQLYHVTLGDDPDVTVRIVKEWSTAYSWNKLALEALSLANSGNLYMLASDDMIFATPLWDKAIKEHYEKLNNKVHVYALQDSRDALGTPHPIVTKEYIETMGYFLPPLFLHWFVDSWTVAIAKGNDCFTHMTDYLLIHEKPSDQGHPDKTHTGIREQGWLERDEFVNKTCQHLLQHEKERLGLAMHGVYPMASNRHLLKALNR